MAQLGKGQVDCQIRVSASKYICCVMCGLALISSPNNRMRKDYGRSRPVFGRFQARFRMPSQGLRVELAWLMVNYDLSKEFPWLVMGRP
jgi:hypothetical protein